MTRTSSQDAPRQLKAFNAAKQKLKWPSEVTPTNRTARLLFNKMALQRQLSDWKPSLAVTLAKLANETVLLDADQQAFEADRFVMGPRGNLVLHPLATLIQQRHATIAKMSILLKFDAASLNGVV